MTSVKVTPYIESLPQILRLFDNIDLRKKYPNYLHLILGFVIETRKFGICRKSEMPGRMEWMWREKIVL